MYDALWKIGKVTPPQVRQLRLWEIALMLGVSEELNPPTESEPQRDDHASRRERRIDLLQQRILHAHGRGPKPEAPTVDPTTVQALGQAFGA